MSLFLPVATCCGGFQIIECTIEILPVVCCQVVPERTRLGAPLYRMAFGRLLDSNDEFLVRRQQPLAAPGYIALEEAESLSAAEWHKGFEVE